MVDGGGNAGLAQEALAEALVLRELGHEDLERDATVQVKVVGAVHDAHASSAGERVDAVAGELRADPRVQPGFRHRRSVEHDLPGNSCYCEPGFSAIRSREGFRKAWSITSSTTRADATRTLSEAAKGTIGTTSSISI